MYEAFYGFTCKPFQLNPDPSFFFGSAPHRKAMDYLQYCLHRAEGFVVVTGEAGTGKTTLVRSLLGGLDPDKLVAATLVSTQMGADDILRAVANAFGIASSSDKKSELLRSIELFITETAQEGKRCLLVVDEAQNLTKSALEELRMLTNIQLDQDALLQCFFVGQTEFRRLLHSPAVRQRVIAACHLKPLDLNETRGYVEHRLACAGANSDLRFQTETCQKIWEASDGIPRRINAICDRILLSGFLEKRQTFTVHDVAAVISELDEELHVPDLLADTAESDLAPVEDLGVKLSRIESTLQRLEMVVSEQEAVVGPLATVTDQKKTSRRRKTVTPDFPKSNL